MNLSKLVKKTSLLLILILTFSLSILGERLSPCMNSDDCGKIIGWLYDYDTGMLINEKFAVVIIAIIDGDTYPHVYYDLIADSGCFSINVKQGQYVMAITPRTKGTKYPHFFDPHKKYTQDEIITVEKGKITEVRKKLQMGGSLKVTLIDPNGQKIDIIQKYHVSNIAFNLKNKDIGYFSSRTMEKDKIESDDMVITNLIPGLYNINAEFPEPGFGAIQGGTVLIESKKTTEYEFIIKIDEGTGIQGYIKDKNGIPLRAVEVLLFKYIKDHGVVTYGDAETNENGYYKIVGIKEGIYSVRLEKNDECYFHSIIIKKNHILDKDMECQ